MPRLDRELRLALRRAKRQRTLTPDQVVAARKVLADDSLLQEFVTLHVVPMAGCVAACTASLTEKSGRPILDWLLNPPTWAKILARLVAFALSLI